MNYKILRRVLCIACPGFLVLLANINLYDPSHVIKRGKELFEGNDPGKMPSFVISICTGREESRDIGVQIERQINQTFVLLKSAALLTNEALRFIVLVDDDSIFNKLVDKIKNWPTRIRNKIVLEKRDAWFPESEDFKAMFRPCATARLFLTEVLPNEDAIVYLDTDMIFLKSPEYLWQEFSKFNSSQMSGISPCLYMYTPKYRFPVYGKSGINSGVWMMNLTRMKSFPGGWIKSCIEASDKYNVKSGLVDQNIANIIFGTNPQFLYELSCRWNYRDNICNVNKHPCEGVNDTGIFLLHGNALTFYKAHNKKFKMMFQEFLYFDVHRPLKELLQSLRKSLKSIVYKNKGSRCLKFSNFDEILTKSFENSISLKN